MRVNHYSPTTDTIQRKKSLFFFPDSSISDVGASHNKPNHQIGNT